MLLEGQQQQKQNRQKEQTHHLPRRKRRRAKQDVPRRKRHCANQDAISRATLQPQDAISRATLQPQHLQPQQPPPPPNEGSSNGNEQISSPHRSCNKGTEQPIRISNLLRRQGARTLPISWEGKTHELSPLQISQDPSEILQTAIRTIGSAIIRSCDDATKHLCDDAKKHLQQIKALLEDIRPPSVQCNDPPKQLRDDATKHLWQIKALLEVHLLSIFQKLSKEVGGMLVPSSYTQKWDRQMVYLFFKVGQKKILLKDGATSNFPYRRNVLLQRGKFKAKNKKIGTKEPYDFAAKAASLDQIK